jgi:YHS domain-containing protein
VERGNGWFEPRWVETGWRFGDRIAIIRGLQPGERIVVSGTFLIDSESRMKLAAAAGRGAAPQEKDLVCGMDVDPGKAAGNKSEYRGKTYYFCSDHCKKEFDKDPKKFLQDKLKHVPNEQPDH